MKAEGLLQMSGVVVDLIQRIERQPEPGGETEVVEFLVAAGGGFNAMMAAKGFGIGITYGGALGRGMFADIAERALRDAGISVLAKHRHASDQGTCVVIVDRNAERTFYTHHGAERWPDRHDIQDLSMSRYAWSLLTGYSLVRPSSAQVLVPWLATIPSASNFLFDPGPLVGDIAPAYLSAALERADWISANQREAATLTGRDDPGAAVRELAQNRTGAIVRCAAAGCWLGLAEGSAELVPGFAVEAVDTTGAGDVHVGAFIGAMCRGYDERAAARLANGAAAVTTTRFGLATAPSLEETLAFVRKRGVDLPLIDANQGTGSCSRPIRMAKKRGEAS
jgi:sugar/nucleoside kinase (ribokinase family)